MQDEDQLSADERELERALRSLRPTAARVNPVAAALEARRRQATWRKPVWIAAAAAAALLVGGAWLAFGPRGHAPEIVELHVPDAAPLLVSVGDGAVDPPTVQAYRRVLGESVTALDDLLDQQAASGDRASPVVMVTPFTNDPFARSM